MMKQQALFETAKVSGPRVYNPKEYRVVCLRECSERENPVGDCPETIAAYYRDVIASSPQHRGEVETMWAIMLNPRKRIKGHCLISTGLLDTLLVHPREIFRPAIVMGAAAVILLHNHPSGDPAPSEADIKVTRDLIKAGLVIKIEVLDHVVMGEKTDKSPKDYSSLRELGYFYT